jgi:hypothetical protein
MALASSNIPRREFRFSTEALLRVRKKVLAVHIIQMGSWKAAVFIKLAY